MSLSVHKNGAWKAATLYVRSGGAWKNSVALSAKLSGAWSSEAVALTAVASPTVVYAIEIGAAPHTSGSVTVTPSGGTGPYTYAWSLVSSDGGAAITANSPSSAATTFTTHDNGAGTGATFHCVVADSAGHSVTVVVAVTFYIVGRLP